jgi:ADP-ribose pyrophosphatase YjhB (NUDIX family)
MPFTRLEIAVLGLVEGALHVLLARRAQAPYAGKWAIPGGALRIDVDRSLDAAALRVMRERTGLESPALKQIGATGGPLRDPRAPWGLSIVYRAVVAPDVVKPTAGKRVEALAWCPAAKVIGDKALAFDHAELVAKAVEATREEVEQLQLPAGLVVEPFTLAELQALSEQLLGRALDKSSFRRRIAERGLVEPIEGAMRGGAFRPAQLFRWKP